MNFTEHKGKVEDVLTYSAHRREGLAQLAAALRERVGIEIDAAKKFEKLAAFSFSAFNTPGLEELTTNLKQVWQAQAHHSKSLADTLERELVQPLNYFYSIQADQHRATSQQIRDLFKRAKTHLAHLEKGRSRYAKACKDAEVLANSLLDAQSGPEEQKRKILGKIQLGRAEIVMSEDEYLSSVHELNTFEVDYSSMLVLPSQTVYLSDIAKQELSRTERLKTDLSKLFAFELGKAKRIISDRERLSKVIDNFSPETEVLAASSSQQIPQLQPVEFAPYSGSHPLFHTATLQMTRLGEDWTDLLRYLTSASQLNFDIEVLMARAWHGDELSDSEWQLVLPTQFRSAMISRQSRRAWAVSINRRRLTARFTLTLDGFSNMGKLMRIALDASCEEGDMKAVRDCIIMSQTFYLRESNPKLFLHSVISDHPMLKTQRFWRDMIENALQAEKNLRKEGEATQEESKASLQAMVFGQLSSFSLIMQSFGCAADITTQVISDFAQRYELPPESTIAILNASEVRCLEQLKERESSLCESPRLEVLNSDPLGVSHSVEPLKSFSVRDSSRP